ncbi:hypothetical protein GCM10027040_11030 [Halomonas shantousis]
MLTYSFEDLAQAFRILLESNWKFYELMPVDTAEAIGTIETAINAKLNAFHSLYDLMLQNGITTVNWYEVPELCTILAIRNARHHNKANRIRSLYNFHRYESDEPQVPETYFYVDFPASEEEEGGDCFDVPLSWHDLDLFLSLPKSESRLRPEAASLIKEYLNSEAFEKEARQKKIPKEHIFFSFVPLTLNAGIALHKHISPHVRTDSIEAQSFLRHFETVCPAITKTHEYQVLRMRFPK